MECLSGQDTCYERESRGWMVLQEWCASKSRAGWRLGPEQRLKVLAWANTEGSGWSEHWRLQLKWKLKPAGAKMEGSNHSEGLGPRCQQPGGRRLLHGSLCNRPPVAIYFMCTYVINFIRFYYYLKCHDIASFLCPSFMYFSFIHLGSFFFCQNSL